ncbi:hypothetical protein MBEHAL_0237 [Halarchaeum acidiphilum MH1-52-1]|uniref:Uncharacterized protein n=1 Tax=Halarchaeum acidiphilum MH1-52-1 TaxID=1261545 RepID=U2YRX0_9EURY|nr:DUF6149 family protein [Halarchaeum acidiphilum]GAD51477.1 hypothetical protein MBEHAL_0237 [Halarchaeum acidiphilum MH1-52-1]
MRLYQTWRNYVAQIALDVPVVRSFVRDWLVGLHVDFFTEASERDADAREDHLRAVFETSIDVYERALAEGYPESHAREITHVQGAFDFYERGWGDLLEFPPDEREAYYEKYRGFFERHGCTLERPFGEFAPPGGFPDAPETPERLDGDYPIAEPGHVDGIYLHTDLEWVREPGENET